MTTIDIDTITEISWDDVLPTLYPTATESQLQEIKKVKETSFDLIYPLDSLNKSVEIFNKTLIGQGRKSLSSSEFISLIHSIEKDDIDGILSTKNPSDFPCSKVCLVMELHGTNKRLELLKTKALDDSLLSQYSKYCEYYLPITTKRGNLPQFWNFMQWIAGGIHYLENCQKNKIGRIYGEIAINHKV